MSDSLTILSNQVQDVDGPAAYYVPMNGETITFTLSGTSGGGNVFVDLHDSVFTPRPTSRP